ncbi:hypothetical protein GF312_08550 [Candidatus Poribacteria bacterium]|nr:hypothetical protein [Candidatus Poribacteria bacterium]
MIKKISISVFMICLSIFMIVNTASSQQDEFLVGYWSFDQGEDVVEDQSGNGNDGTITGDVNWIEGKSGTALEFTAGANVEIPDSDSLRDMDEYTIAFWFRLNEFAPEWNHLFEKDGSYGITINSGAEDLRFTPNSSKVWIESGAKVKTDIWYYITMKTDGTSVYFYVDGNEETKFDEPVVFTNNSVNIAHAAPYTVNGAYDEVKIWAKALTEDEIKIAMTGASPVLATDLSFISLWSKIRNATLDTGR